MRLHRPSIAALAAILSSGVPALSETENACRYEAEDVQSLVSSAKKVAHCFADDDTNCKLAQRSIVFQKNINAVRLIPVDRSNDSLLNDATGRVTITFKAVSKDGDAGQIFSASAARVSRCHIATSAHLLYLDGSIAKGSNDFELVFHQGQSCRADKPFVNTMRAEVFYAMLDFTKGDFICEIGNTSANCYRRQIRGDRDVVLLRVPTAPQRTRFYSIAAADANKLVIGQRVDCWGYPSFDKRLGLTEVRSQLFLWHQARAQIFPHPSFQPFKGLLSSAVVYSGMSGGGCALSEVPNELVALHANDNQTDGRPAVAITPDGRFTQQPNYLATFDVLRKRYEEDTGKLLSKLDELCD